MISIHQLEDTDVQLILQPILGIGIKCYLVPSCLIIFQATKFQIISSEGKNRWMSFITISYYSTSKPGMAMQYWNAFIFSRLTFITYKGVKNYSAVENINIQKFKRKTNNLSLQTLMSNVEERRGKKYSSICYTLKQNMPYKYTHTFSCLCSITEYEFNQLFKTAVCNSTGRPSTESYYVKIKS